MKTRTLTRFINRALKDGPYMSAEPQPGYYLFQNRASRIIGIIDRGDHYDLHDIKNLKDQLQAPTAKLSKGKHLRVIEGKIDPGTPYTEIKKTPEVESLERLVFGGAA